MWKKGFRHSEESKRLMSERMKASRAAETPEQKASRESKRRPLSEETKRKISLAHIGMKHTQESKSKMGATKRALKMKHSPERRAYMSSIMRGRPAPFPMRRFYYKNIPFRSSWEVRAAKAMDSLGILWHYECNRFDLGSQTYAPDFYLPEDGAYWEVKGYFGPKSKKTIELFRKMYPEIPLVLLSDRGLRMLENAAGNVCTAVER